MRNKRLKIEGGSAVYHCTTRTVNGAFLFDPVSRERLLKQLWQVADFSGVEVLTYCVMSNHFHVLFRVPDREVVVVSDRELLRRYAVLYPEPTQYQTMTIRNLKAVLKRGGREAVMWRRRLPLRVCRSVPTLSSSVPIPDGPKACRHVTSIAVLINCCP